MCDIVGSCRLGKIGAVIEPWPKSVVRKSNDETHVVQRLARTASGPWLVMQLPADDIDALG